MPHKFPRMASKMTLAQENVVLSLFGTAPDGLTPIEMQKLMFLISQEYITPLYDFIPYEQGCYSPTLASDVHKLADRNLVKTISAPDGQKRWKLTEEGLSGAVNRRAVAAHVAQFRRKYPLRGMELLADIYRKYPYYCIKSKIIKSVLPNDKDALAAIERAKPRTKTPLASIGYEGRTFENYLNSLIRHGITILCDVRKNPISRKYGFSKATLQRACDGIGVSYRHYPELGIPSSERCVLNCQSDYDALFERYEREILPTADDSVAEIARLVSDGECVALTCFEANLAQCHRTRVLASITRKTGVEVEHI